MQRVKPGDFVIGVLTAALAAGIYLAGLGGEGQLEAQVRQDGQLVRRIALSGLEQPVRIELKRPDGGFNIVLAQDGRVRMESASCAHQDCVRIGWLEKGGQSAICLENRVSITVTAREHAGPDAIVR